MSLLAYKTFILPALCCCMDASAEVMLIPLATNVESVVVKPSDAAHTAIDSSVGAAALPSRIEFKQSLPQAGKNVMTPESYIVVQEIKPVDSPSLPISPSSSSLATNVAPASAPTPVKKTIVFSKKKVLATKPASEPAPTQGGEKATSSVVSADQSFRQQRMVAFDAQQLKLSDYLKTGEKEKALSLMKEMYDEAVHFEDFGFLGSMGYLAMGLNDEDTALKAIRKAADLTEDDEFYEHLGNITIHFGHVDEAEAVLKKMDPKSDETTRLKLNIAVNKANTAYKQGNYAQAEKLLLEHEKDLDARGVELLAWTQYRYGKMEDAAKNFEKAYAAAPSQSNAQGMMYASHRLKRYDTLLSVAKAKPGPLVDLLPPDVRDSIAAGGKRFTVNKDGVLAVTTNDVAEVKPGISAKVNPNIREKRGTDGEGQLSQRGVVVTAGWQGENDNVTVQADVLRTDNKVDASTGQRFYSLWTHSEEGGLVYRLGAGRSLSGGVLDPAFVGEIGLASYTPDYGLSVRAFRRSVEDSVLSTSGSRSNVTGLQWGRVLETGVTLSGSYKLDDWSTESSLVVSSLSGVNVADNTKFEFYGRALYPIKSVPGLALGPEVFTNHFQRNLGYYDYGFGGYWSPEFSFRLGGLASYATNIEGLQLKILAGMGWGWETQSAADGNPLTGTSPGFYPATRSNGLSYLGQIDAVYPIDNRWNIGFNLGGQRSTAYTEWRAGIYLESFWGN